MLRQKVDGSVSDRSAIHPNSSVFRNREFARQYGNIDNIQRMGIIDLLLVKRLQDREVFQRRDNLGGLFQTGHLLDRLARCIHISGKERFAPHGC